MIEPNLRLFYEQVVKPDEFDAALKQAVGRSKLEEIKPAHIEKYEFLVTVDPEDMDDIVSRVKKVKGVKSILDFTSIPMA